MGDDMFFLPQPFPPFDPRDGQKQQQQKLTPWEMLSKGKTLGKRIDVSVNDDGASTTTEFTTSLNMFEVSASDDAAAMPLTITLCPPQVGDSDSSQTNRETRETGFGSPWYAAVAVVEWGTGGVACRAEVDILNGAKICLSASYVRIGAFMENPPGDQGSSTYVLSSFISPGLDKGLGAQRTIYGDEIPAAANTLFPTDFGLPVPAFARRVRLTGIVAGVPAGFVGSIIFYRDKNFTAPICEYLFAENTPDSFFIPSGAMYFQFQTGAANITAMAAVFDLAI